MFVIFDLDGTLADASHRLHYLDQDPRPYEDFYRACVKDAPIRPMLNTLRAFRDGGAAIEIWTGRSDFVRTETRAWLERFGFPHTPLKMRPHGDHGNDAEMKREWLYDRLLVGQPKPDLVFEDRTRVVNMWRDEGIPCCQVAPGDF